MRWLVSKQTDTGGWASSQDTVVALQALAAYAERCYSADSDVVCRLRNDGHEKEYRLNAANSLVNRRKKYLVNTVFNHLWL